ncbi:MAG: hypothetical protein GX299_06925 [Epulopiscium sp.]|nr:hypothetical protein [Candidatus Epulonipiscium sp.]
MKDKAEKDSKTVKEQRNPTLKIKSGIKSDIKRYNPKEAKTQFKKEQKNTKK